MFNLARTTGLILLAIVLSGSSLTALAQSRLNDHDVQAVMQNLRDDSKSFRSAFDSAVKKSTIRKTSQEKDARTQVANFERQTESTLRQFKNNKKADVHVQSMMESANSIDHLLQSVSLDDRTNSAWGKVRADLTQLSSAFSQ